MTESDREPIVIIALLAALAELAMRMRFLTAGLRDLIALRLRPTLLGHQFHDRPPRRR